MNLGNTKLIEKMQDYEKQFEKDFPTFQFMGYPDNKVIEIIEDCLKKNKGVYELGYLSRDVYY